MIKSNNTLLTLLQGVAVVLLDIVIYGSTTDIIEHTVTKR
jgi:hypothetical protein